jgi:hypothetical protein
VPAPRAHLASQPKFPTKALRFRGSTRPPLSLTYPTRAEHLAAREAAGRPGYLAFAAAAVIAAVAHGPATKATPAAAPALRARLLAAIDTASGDILYTHGALGGGNWQFPAYPQPGQGVHLHILGVGSDGTIFKDGEYSFKMPAENPATNYTANLDQGGLQLSGAFLAVDHQRHVWGEWHAKFILGFTLDAAGIRAEIANGQFTVAGRTELHGQQAIELKINVPLNNEAPPHITAERLWVNATTYLPMRGYQRMSNGQQSLTDYTFLPPTPANLAKLRPVIPAGYTRVSRTQVTDPKLRICRSTCPPKPKTIKN